MLIPTDMLSHPAPLPILPPRNSISSTTSVAVRVAEEVQEDMAAKAVQVDMAVGLVLVYSFIRQIRLLLITSSVTEMAVKAAGEEEGV